MSAISRGEGLNHPRLPGVTVYPFSDALSRGTPQEVLVEITANVSIPLHSHTVDARMMIVNGEARVLSSDPNLHGQIVRPGDVVFFERDVDHGFAALDHGMAFVSRNGGIVAPDHDAWDIVFA